MASERVVQTAVAALYVHGPRGSVPEDLEPTPMISVNGVDVVESMGIRQDPRYSRKPPEGRERNRQLSLIDEGTIWRLERRFGPIPRELVKAQIILAGDVHLPALTGAKLRFAGGPEVVVAIERKPCFAMDLICTGLREAMQGGHQGALGRVLTSGPIQVGDAVEIVHADSPQPMSVGA